MRGLCCAALLLTGLVATVARGDTDLLRDEQNRPVSTSHLNGRWLVVTFGYSRCPDICPTTLHTLAGALARLGPTAQAVDAYFVSVDPEHDTPQVLRRFLNGISPRLHGLTGSAVALNDARRTFGVPARSSGAGFDHGVFLYLVDPHGQVTETFHPDVTTDRLTQRLRARLATR